MSGGKLGRSLSPALGGEGRERGKGERVSKSFLQLLKDSISICHHAIIAEAYNPVSALSESGRSPFVQKLPSILPVNVSVDFNDQFPFRTAKIDDEMINGQLSIKFPDVEPLGTQLPPHDPLSASHGTPHGFCAGQKKRVSLHERSVVVLGPFTRPLSPALPPAGGREGFCKRKRDVPRRRGTSLL